jgi:hypothetical protein
MGAEGSHSSERRQERLACVHRARPDPQHRQGLCEAVAHAKAREWVRRLLLNGHCFCEAVAHCVMYRLFWEFSGLLRGDGGAILLHPLI